MAFINPKGRANYEPNSWGGAAGGPRESPEKGFNSYPAEEQGAKLRIRPETFADHYSQARQFYFSQTEIEQNHIADAFTFELSKVKTPAIRARMVSHLLNVDEALAKKVAMGLRLEELPKPAEAARPTRMDLNESPALSIVLNGPESFKGRKIGVLVSDGVDIELVKALKAALDQEGALMELVAPMVGGVKANDGTWIEADEKVNGAPSVLYDAVALLLSEDGAKLLANEATARDFVTDAFAHAKFIAYVGTAMPLLEKAGVAADMDGGFAELKGGTDATEFVQMCRKLRVWERKAKVKQV
jgi:catalase